LWAQSRLALKDKYAKELHCNEVMLLPYYIASMNIEHEYLDLMDKKYQPFDGICLADTFELAEGVQSDMFVPENTERVKKQQETNFFVIIGNPPYNVGQVNENDNNKNRKYKVIDGRVKETYSKESKATLRNALSDPYVKAIRWASDRIGDEGIVAFVTNNSFLDGIAFDGMRKHLGEEFSKLYMLDLGGNVRKNPKLSGTTHNVFGIQVGVSINLLVKRKDCKNTDIFYARVGEDWRKEAKYAYLDEKQHIAQVEWQIITPNKKHTWLTEGLHSEFDEFLPLGSKETKAEKGITEGVIFKIYSRGIATNGDAYVYNSNFQFIIRLAQNMVENYQSEQNRWQESGQPKPLEDFLQVDESCLKWIRNTKRNLMRGNQVTFNEEKICISLYRPFYRQFYYFERIFNEDIYQFPKIFPTPDTENENMVICVPSAGSKQVVFFITNVIPDLNFFAGSTPNQCFPFYTYNEDGSNRTENITDWALTHYRHHYKDNTITKWAIFHYTYGLLHHPAYREKYAANLKRELPRLPMAPDFWSFSKSGEKLADLHLNYEDATPYPLKMIENPKVPFSLKVEKMRLSKDKCQLIYNDFIKLDGIPKEVSIINWATAPLLNG
jgi:predicted helicase